MADGTLTIFTRVKIGRLGALRRGRGIPIPDFPDSREALNPQTP